MGRIATGWSIAKQSFTVIKHDKEILIYPLLAAITIILTIVILLLIGAFGITGASLISAQVGTASAFLFFAVIIVISYFISTFFQAAIITSATIRFSGRNPTLGDGLKGPTKHLLPLLVWASINALVGTILGALKNAGRRSSRGVSIGTQVAASAAGIAWGLVTFFTVPIILFEKQGPIAGIKRSWHLFKQTWGENVTAQFSVGAIFFLISLPFLILMLIAVFSSNLAFIIVAGILLLLAIITINIFSTSINGILRAALYQYAITGRMPHIYNPETVKHMFVRK